MENNKKQVTVKVTSNEGHTEFTTTSKDAIEKINEIYESEGKWVYVDGTNVAPSRLTESMLEDAQNITLANIVVGGHCCEEGLSAIFDLHITNFTNQDGDSEVEGMDENSTFPITIEMVMPDQDKLVTEPRIRLWIDESKIVEVIHMRNLIFKGLKRKLDEFAENGLAEYRHIYNV